MKKITVLMAMIAVSLSVKYLFKSTENEGRFPLRGPASEEDFESHEYFDETDDDTNYYDNFAVRKDPSIPKDTLGVPHRSAQQKALKKLSKNKPIPSDSN